MEKMEQKEKRGFRLTAEQRLELLIALGRKRDWKTKKARENFNRPAFWGTALETKSHQESKSIDVGGG